MTTVPRDDRLRAEPAQSPGLLMWRATLRWQRSVATALRPVGLTHVQFALLASVWWLSDGAERLTDLPSQRQVAEHAQTDVMMTSQVLRTLEVRGLVTRTQDPADARVRRLRVTEDGRRVAAEAVAVVELADHDFFARGGDRSRLVEVLRGLSGEPDAARVSRRGRLG